MTKKEKKIELKEFINQNMNEITIIGMFLVVLSISLGFIDNLNKDYAGYLIICTAIINLIILNSIIPKEDEANLSWESSILTIFIAGISFVIFLIAYENYFEQFKDVVINGIKLFFIGIGIFSSSKLFNYVDKKMERNLFWRLSPLFWIPIFLLIGDYFIIFFKYIFEQFNIERYLLFDYFRLFFMSIFIVILLCGVGMLLEFFVEEVYKKYIKVFFNKKSS